MKLIQRQFRWIGQVHLMVLPMATLFVGLYPMKSPVKLQGFEESKIRGSGNCKHKDPWKNCVGPCCTCDRFWHQLDGLFNRECTLLEVFNWNSNSNPSSWPGYCVEILGEHVCQNDFCMMGKKRQCYKRFDCKNPPDVLIKKFPNVECQAAGKPVTVYTPGDAADNGDTITDISSPQQENFDDTFNSQCRPENGGPDRPPVCPPHP